MDERFPPLYTQEELDAGEALDELHKHRFTIFTIEDLEFSDYGRSERFGPGWWIIPTALLSFGLAGLLAWLWLF